MANTYHFLWLCRRQAASPASSLASSLAHAVSRFRTPEHSQPERLHACIAETSGLLIKEKSRPVAEPVQSLGRVWAGACQAAKRLPPCLEGRDAHIGCERLILHIFRGRAPVNGLIARL